MPDFEFEGTIDSNGNIRGTLKEKSDGDCGALGVIGMVVIYAMCLLGGIIMIVNVAKESPACIVPAVMGFVLMLVPIVIAVGAGDFFVSLLKTFYRWSDLLLGTVIVIYWIAFLSQAVSVPVLTAMTIGLMYSTGVSAYKVYQKAGVAGCVITVAIPIIVYLICNVTVDEISFGHLALIPTISIILSFLIKTITEIYDFEDKCLHENIAGPIFKTIAFVCIIASVLLFGGFTGSQKADLLQEAKNHILENQFREAREVLQDIKSQEAKELYDSIRYKDLQAGEVIYNGYYDFADGRSVSEDGVAFVCLDVADERALLISVDVIRLAEQFDAVLDEEFYASEYSLDMDHIVSTSIEDKAAKFFLLSKEQYDFYVKKDGLDAYLKSAPVSDVAMDQKKSVDRDTYKWTQPYIDIWLLNDFAKEEGAWVGTVGTVNTATGAYEKIQNIKVYAGIRLCYYADVKE